MSKFIMRDAYIAVNGTNLSDHCRAVAVEATSDEVDMTAFGPAGYRDIAQGFKDSTITATFYSDFAAGAVNSVLQPLYDSGGTFSVEVRSSSAAVSSTNPKATLNARMYTYNGIAGAVGDPATFDTSFRNAGTAGLVWGTT